MTTDEGNRDGHGTVRPPTHPVPQLQKPFEESMMESIDNCLDEEVPTDALTRRAMLLEAPTYQRVIAGRWKQKPGERYHPLWKLVAQMSFGMHLLAGNMAKSEEEVMRILQSHVDDIDGFLERTTDDFDLAQSDIHERIRCLKLPLAHGDVFDRMLEDRSFRASILDGNEKIEHVVSRTKRAAKDALKDVQKGFDATNVLEKYLMKLNSTWKRESPEHEAVLVAMLGNVEGWHRAFLELHLQGNKLAGSLTKLAEIVTEMERRAATVSRNMLVNAIKVSASQFSKYGQAKAQRMSQQASRPHSERATLSSQKPLPTEPTRHTSTRPSSRGTQLTGFMTHLNTHRKSGQGLSSQSPARASQLPRSPESRKQARPETGERSHVSGARTPREPRAQQAMRSVPFPGQPLREAGNSHAIELPAEVPQEILRQAPVSVNNRLSMTLGVKPRDISEHRVSSIYYPKALGNLLKSPAVSSLLLTPKSSQSKGTPVLAVTTTKAMMPGGETDYYLSHEQSPSLGMITPDSQTDLQSTRNSSEPVRDSAQASVTGSRPPTRRSSVPHLAFTSHPAVMAMVLAPSELPANTDLQARPSSSESKQGASSGEPGPEMAETTTTTPLSVSEPETIAEVHIIEDSTLPDFTEEAIADSQENAEIPVQLEPEEQPSSSEDLTEEEVTAAASTEKPTLDDDDEGRLVTESLEEASTDIKTETVGGKPYDTDTATHYIAELEASTPEAPETQPEREVGPVELEAPMQTFRLPPRPLEALKSPEKEVARASITQLEDFFKLPTEQTIKPGFKPKDFGSSGTPQPIRPLKLRLAKKDGKIVPVQVDGPEESQGPSNSDSVADIIETISQTPPASSIHSRSLSFTSATSAQPQSHRSSHSWGSPEQAPSPPGPGGRSMVNPDFATAGQFEEERKQKKKGGAGSKSGWKSLFGGSTNTAQNSGSSSASPSARRKRISRFSPQAVPNADTTRASGTDLVWFRGGMNKTMGVSSA